LATDNLGATNAADIHVHVVGPNATWSFTPGGDLSSPHSISAPVLYIGSSNIWSSGLGPDAKTGIGTLDPQTMLEVRLDATNAAAETMYLANGTPYGTGVGTAGSKLGFTRGIGSWNRMSYVEGGNARENSSADGYISLGVKTNNVFQEVFRSETNVTTIKGIQDLSISGALDMPSTNGWSFGTTRQFKISSQGFRRADFELENAYVGGWSTNNWHVVGAAIVSEVVATNNASVGGYLNVGGPTANDTRFLDGSTEMNLMNGTGGDYRNLFLGTINALYGVQVNSKPGLDATIDVLVAGGTTNRLVYSYGVLISNIVGHYVP
jgi:hypothetical protein